MCFFPNPHREPQVELTLAPEREDRRLGCRVYATAEGSKGSPTAEMLRAAPE